MKNYQKFHHGKDSNKKLVENIKNLEKKLVKKY